MQEEKNKQTNKQTNKNLQAYNEQVCINYPHFTARESGNKIMMRAEHKKNGSQSHNKRKIDC